MITYILYSPHSKANASREVLLRISAQHVDSKALSLVALETIPVSNHFILG
jgi:hypothetical protein